MVTAHDYPHDCPYGGSAELTPLVIIRYSRSIDIVKATTFRELTRTKTLMDNTAIHATADVSFVGTRASQTGESDGRSGAMELERIMFPASVTLAGCCLACAWL